MNTLRFCFQKEVKDIARRFIFRFLWAFSSRFVKSFNNLLQSRCLEKNIFDYISLFNALWMIESCVTEKCDHCHKVEVNNIKDFRENIVYCVKKVCANFQILSQRLSGKKLALLVFGSSAKLWQSLSQWNCLKISF